MVPRGDLLVLPSPHASEAESKIHSPFLKNYLGFHLPDCRFCVFTYTLIVGSSLSGKKPPQYVGRRKGESGSVSTVDVEGKELVFGIDTRDGGRTKGIFEILVCPTCVWQAIKYDPVDLSFRIETRGSPADFYKLISSLSRREQIVIVLHDCIEKAFNDLSFRRGDVIPPNAVVAGVTMAPSVDGVNYVARRAGYMGKINVSTTGADGGTESMYNFWYTSGGGRQSEAEILVLPGVDVAPPPHAGPEEQVSWVVETG